MGQDYTNMIYKIAHKYSFGNELEDAKCLCMVLMSKMQDLTLKMLASISYSSQGDNFLFSIFFHNFSSFLSCIFLNIYIFSFLTLTILCKL